MLRPQTMLVLAEVEAGCKWFQEVLGLSSGHGGSKYEMLMDGGLIVAQLHQWDAHKHPHLGDEQDPSHGNSLLLWFATNDVYRLLSRTEDTGATVLNGPRYNPNGGQREIWLSVPEQYRVVVAGPRDGT